LSPNRQWLAYDTHAIILGLGLLLVYLGAGGAELAPVGWLLVYVGLMLQATYLGLLVYPSVKEPLAAIRQQFVFIVLISLQIVLLVSSPRILSFPISSVAVTLLAVVLGHILFEKRTREKRLAILRELGDLINEFITLNFEPKNEKEDISVIRLLDHYAITHNPITTDEKEYSQVTGVGSSYLTLRSWCSGIAHKVDLTLRSIRSPQERDIGRTVDEFVLFYNDYVRNVVVNIVEIVNKVPPDPRQMVRLRFSLFREKLGEIMNRLNALVKKLRAAGYVIPEEATTLLTDLR
jgi:hypothetical protein